MKSDCFLGELKKCLFILLSIKLVNVNLIWFGFFFPFFYRFNKLYIYIYIKIDENVEFDMF